MSLINLLGSRNGEAFSGLALAGGMQVTAGAKLHDITRVMRSVKLSIQSREKRMVKHTQNILLHICPLQLLPYFKSLPIHHLHSIEALRQPHHWVPNLAKVHISDVSAADAAEQAEVVEPYKASLLAAEAVHGLPTGLVGLVGLVGVGIIGGVSGGAAGD